jgi:hypothetical protein
VDISSLTFKNGIHYVALTTTVLTFPSHAYHAFTLGELLKLRLEKTKLTSSIDSFLGAVTGVSKPAVEGGGEADGSQKNEEGDDPYGTTEELIDTLSMYAKSETRSLAIVQREEELLKELQKRIRKERLELQYMGTHPRLKRQGATRNLEVSVRSKSSVLSHAEGKYS